MSRNYSDGTHKVCRECGERKPVNEFRHNKSIYTRKKTGEVVEYSNPQSNCMSCERTVHNRYYQKNSTHYAEKCRERYYNNEQSRLGKVMQTAIRKVLRGKKAGSKWQELVGYTTEQLVKHLESKFEDGMSWENYGEWHVDHIIPKSWFHYESPEDWQFRVCWSRYNLQPMWASENLSKQHRFSHKVEVA